MTRKRAKVIPKNVLAQEELRRKYVEEPWPQKLILVKSTLKDNDIEDNDIEVRGSVTKLFYNLSYPYLYIDSRDLEGLGDMVTEAKDAKAVRRDTGNIARHDSSTDTEQAKSTGKRKRGRPKKSSRSKTDGSSDTDEARRVSTGDNK